MKKRWADYLNIPQRATILLTRRLVWVDCATGQEYPEKVSLSFAWTLVGVHSYKWWWVRRYGRLGCGCTRNPLTRRFVAYRYECPERHGFLNNLPDTDDTEGGRQDPEEQS